ncbi:MAG: GAF domain-containing protein [Myxococcales bacterium]|nr:GAF domain-containing protein [Polyangiaceae bacterium]MDW8251008.1 GAF domain-containing protein [Myxococcales bacterium]
MVDPLDPFARHLAQLLSVIDLVGRLQPPGDESAAARDAVLLARTSTGAERASLFQIDNADANTNDPLWVMRLARSSVLEDGVAPMAAFHPAYVSLLLAPLQSGAVESLGPLSGHEPFYAQHLHHEPHPPRFAALAPVLVDGAPVGVLEIARQQAPFSPTELICLEAASRTVAAAVYGTRRERSMQAMFTSLLPELLDPARAATSLPARLRDWIASRRMAPTERQAIAVATTIAELAAASPAALELVQSVLSSTRKAFVGREVGGWSEVHGALRC